MKNQTLLIQEKIKDSLLEKGKQIEIKNRIYSVLDSLRCGIYLVWTLFITGVVGYLFVANARGRSKIFEMLPFIKGFKAPGDMIFSWFDGITFVDDKWLRAISALIALMSIFIVPLAVSLLFLAVAKKFYKAKGYSSLYLHSDSISNAKKISDKANENLNNAKKVSMSNKKALCYRIILNVICSVYLTLCLSFSFYKKSFTGTVFKLLKKLFTKGVYDERLLNHFVITGSILIISAFVLYLIFRLSFKFMDDKINSLYNKGIEEIESMSDLCDLVMINIDPKQSKAERKAEKELQEKERREAEEREKRRCSSIPTAFPDTSSSSSELSELDARWAIASGMMSMDVTDM